MTKLKPNNSQMIIEGKVFAILSYLSIFCIIPLLFKKDNDFVLFHGKQGLVIFLGEVAIFILHIIMQWIFRPGMFFLGVFSFIGIIAVLRGKNLELPIVSKLANKITL
jgi:fumarate reductase subunit D